MRREEDCYHDWELTYADGPLDTSDWKCKCCGKHVVGQRGQEPPPARDNEES